MYIHFGLEKPNSERSPIMMTYRHNGFRFRYSLGYSINCSLWDKLREEEKCNGSSIVNLQIDRLRALTRKMIIVLTEKLERHPTRLEMKLYLNEHFKGKSRINQFKPEKVVQPQCLIEYFRELLIQWKESGRIKQGSAKGYNRSLNILSAAVGGTLPSTEFQKKTISTIVSYMRNRGNEESYVKKTIGHIQNFVNYAIKDDRFPNITSNPVVAKDFGLRDYKSDAIYLSQEEVDLIRELDLSGQPRMEIARDIFLMAVYTGQRFSDVTDSNKWQLGETKEGNRYLSYTSLKTGIPSKVPLNEYAIQIILRYPEGFPKRSNVELNRMVKEIGRLAGIDKVVVRTRHRGGREVHIQAKKYTQISMHTARRTFCTIAVLEGLPTRQIMAFSGHNTEASFNTYVQASREELIDQAILHPFFNQKLRK